MASERPCNQLALLCQRPMEIALPSLQRGSYCRGWTSSPGSGKAGRKGSRDLYLRALVQLSPSVGASWPGAGGAASTRWRPRAARSHYRRGCRSCPRPHLQQRLPPWRALSGGTGRRRRSCSPACRWTLHVMSCFGGCPNELLNASCGVGCDCDLCCRVGQARTGCMLPRAAPGRTWPAGGALFSGPHQQQEVTAGRHRQQQQQQQQQQLGGSHQQDHDQQLLHQRQHAQAQHSDQGACLSGIAAQVRTAAGHYMPCMHGMQSTLPCSCSVFSGRFKRKHCTAVYKI